MAKEEDSEKKIIIDEDWKQQAKKDKDILAEQEKAEKDKTKRQRRQALPEGNFAALVSMLVTQSLFSLGLIQVEGQQPREPDLELAKYNIDMLEMLEKKTKGNLTEQEQKVLTDMLNEVRMAYVKVAG
jgi:hypothetical protein